MKILIIGPSWVGDMVMSNSLYQNLHTLHPNVKIDVLTPAWCEPILDKMPEVHKAISMPLGHGEFNFSKRKQLAKTLQKNNYDQAIVIPNSFKSALIPFLAKIPIRTGWRGEMRYGLINDLRVLDKAKYPAIIMRYNALAYPNKQTVDSINLTHPYPHLIVSQESLQNSLTLIKKTTQRSLPEKFVVICPGAEYGPAKCWPHYHFATLTNLLIASGHKVVIMGSPKDITIANKISELVKKPDFLFNLTGQTALNIAVDIMSLATAVISNDSGLMHVAAALSIPLVALFGPTDSIATPPLSKQAIIIRKITGNLKIRSSNDSPEGYHLSMINISPEEVVEQFNKLTTAKN